MSDRLHGVFRAAINGEHQRKVGGFVYVKKEECCYMFPNELAGQQDLTDSLTDLLSDNDQSRRVVYVVEQQDEHLHLLAYPRDRIAADLASEATASEATASEATASEATAEATASEATAEATASEATAEATAEVR